MGKFHINDKDEVKPCKATIKKCKFGDKKHFSTIHEAEQELVENFNNKTIKTLSKIKPDTLSANISKNYSHLSIIFDHMHNSGHTGNELEQYYYNSPAGRLELERRTGKGNNIDKTYIKIKEIIDDPEFQPIDTKINENKLNESIQTGYESFSEKFGEKDKELDYEYSDIDPKTNEMRHALVEESHKWYLNLSTEQQEAISELTSSGFEKLQYAHGIKTNSPANFIFDTDIDIDEFYETYDGNDFKEELNRRFSSIGDEYKKNIDEAFKHTPKLEKPIITYRGTSLEEIKEIAGFDSETDDKQFTEKMLNGELDNQNISEKSRLANLPISSTVSTNIAKRFGKGIYLEIKRHTSSSPVLNSAWGSYEQEFLTNPNSKYKIIEAVESQNKRDKGLIVRIEEIAN